MSRRRLDSARDGRGPWQPPRKRRIWRQRRTRHFGLLFTPEEHQHFSRKAHVLGLSLSAWVRGACFASAGSIQPLVDPRQVDLEDVLRREEQAAALRTA